MPEEETPIRPEPTRPPSEKVTLKRFRDAVESVGATATMSHAIVSPPGEDYKEYKISRGESNLEMRIPAKTYEVTVIWLRVPYTRKLPDRFIPGIEGLSGFGNVLEQDILKALGFEFKPVPD